MKELRKIADIPRPNVTSIRFLFKQLREGFYHIKSEFENRKLSKLRQERDDLAEAVVAQHPDIIRLDQEIETTQGMLDTLLAPMLTEIQKCYREFLAKGLTPRVEARIAKLVDSVNEEVS